MLEIGGIAGGEVIHTDDAVAFGEEAVCKVRAKKSGGAGNENTGLQ
jgi:hypothetical protein